MTRRLLVQANCRAELMRFSHQQIGHLHARSNGLRDDQLEREHKSGGDRHRFKLSFASDPIDHANLPGTMLLLGRAHCPAVFSRA